MKFMLKTFGIILLLTLGGFGGYRLFTVFEPKPKVQVDAFDQDIGVVKYPGQLPLAYFEITNVGNAPLEMHIHKESGFDDLDLHDPELRQGEKTRVRGLLKAPVSGDRFFGRAILETNDPRMPEVLLTATGVVGRYIRTRPDTVDFGIRSADSKPLTHTSTIELANLGDSETLRRLEVLSSGKFFDATLVREDGLAVEVNIRVKAGTSLGLLRELVVLGIPGEPDPYGEILAAATLRGRYSIAPPGFLFSGAAPDEPMDKSVVIGGLEPHQYLSIDEAELSLPECYEVVIENESTITVIFDGSIDCLKNIFDYYIPVEVRDAEDRVLNRLQLPVRAVPSVKYAYLRH